MQFNEGAALSLSDPSDFLQKYLKKIISPKGE